MENDRSKDEVETMATVTEKMLTATPPRKIASPEHAAFLRALTEKSPISEQPSP